MIADKMSRDPTFSYWNKYCAAEAYCQSFWDMKNVLTSVSPTLSFL